MTYQLTKMRSKQSDLLAAIYHELRALRISDHCAAAMVDGMVLRVAHWPSQEQFAHITELAEHEKLEDAIRKETDRD